MKLIPRADYDQAKSAGSETGGFFPMTGAPYGVQLTTFLNPNPRPNDQFGRAVAAVDDRVLIGSRFADGMLTLIPEPSALLLAGLGVVMLLVSPRRRRRVA